MLEPEQEDPVPTSQQSGNPSMSAGRRLISTGLLLAASLPALTGLISCAESDAELLGRLPQTSSADFESGPSDLLDMQISIQGEGLRATEPIHQMFPVYESQYVFGPHFNAFNMEIEVGWHWDNVQVGEEPRQVGSYYEFEDVPNLRVRAIGKHPGAGCDTVVGKLVPDASGEGYCIEAGRFIDSSTLEH